MAGPIFVKYAASPAAMTEGNKRVARCTKSGALVATQEADLITFVPVLDTGIYADNDVMFISTEITNFFRTAGGRAELVSATLFDGDDQGTEVFVFLTTNSTTPGTINEAISGADAVMDDIQAYIDFVTYEDLINSKVCHRAGINKILEAAAGSTSLYAWGAVRSGTPTYTASGVKILFGVKHYD